MLTLRASVSFFRAADQAGCFHALGGAGCGGDLDVQDLGQLSDRE
jgi:hypothetical protein